MVLSGMILDITARKAMEDRLRRSEERFQIAVRQAGISVWEYDIPARRLYSSGLHPGPWGGLPCCGAGPPEPDRQRLWFTPAG